MESNPPLTTSLAPSKFSPAAAVKGLPQLSTTALSWRCPGVVLAVAETADAADPAGDVEDALVVFTGIRASRVRVVQELPSTLMALVGHRHRRHSLGPVLER